MAMVETEKFFSRANDPLATVFDSFGSNAEEDKDGPSGRVRWTLSTETGG